MGTKIDYQALCQEAMVLLDLVHQQATTFSKFELSGAVEDEITEILELSGKARQLKEPYKELFATIMDDVGQIQDDLEEIEMVTGDLIGQVNKLSPDQREAWFRQLGIKFIPKEFEGVGEDLQEHLKQMFYYTMDLLKTSEQYYSLEREEYIDFEGEIG